MCEFLLIYLIYFSWPPIDTHLHCLYDRNSEMLKYLLNIFIYLYGFRSGVRPHICDWPGLHLASLRPCVQASSSER
jgi:hypothetical protein